MYSILNKIDKAIADAEKTISSLRGQKETIAAIAKSINEAIAGGKKVMFVGNGGSAADAQHAAAELVGRLGLGTNRRALPAIALTTDTSAITALANDFGFEEVFARQVEAIARAGDVLVCISTSGRSENILHAARAAIQIGCSVVSLTGGGDSPLSKISNICLEVEGPNTPRIQEAHELALHIICELVEIPFAN